MRIFQITMESSCFAAVEGQQSFVDEINQLVKWNNKGWIDLIKSDVLEKETDALIGKPKKNLKEKTKTLATDYGPNLFGHTHTKWGFSGRKSKLPEIYTALFGKPLWQKGKKEKNKIRDAMHLFTSHSKNGLKMV